MTLSVEYIAGFFDGEGSIGIYTSTPNKSGKSYIMRTQLCQVDSYPTRKILNELKDRFGGSLSAQSSSSGRGKINWQMSGVNALNFLLFIRDHLILKQDQADLAIHWQQNRPLACRDELGRVMSFGKKEQMRNDKAVKQMKILKRSA